MNTEQLFRATLQKLAAEGVQDAVLALRLAESISPAPAVRVAMIKNELQEAHTSLLEALKQNDINWSRTTDRHINRALSNIARSIGELA